jgi:chromosome segregation ATPase
MKRRKLDQLPSKEIELLQKHLDTKTVRKDELGTLKDELAAIGTILSKIEINASRSVVAADLHVDEFSSAFEALQADRDQYKASMHEWQDKHATMSTSRDHYQSQAEQLALDKTDLEDKLHEARSEGVRIDEEKKDLEKELAELKETMKEKDEAHEAEIKKLKGKLNKSKKDNLAMIQQWQKAAEDSE